jgi:hypothetical protein
MFTEEDIASAIEAGVLTKETADAFRAYVAKGKCQTPVDEEPLRLITGFNDIFVVIACLLLLTSMAWLGGIAARWLGALLVSVTAWLLAEFFVRKRRMALPAIVLSLAFVDGILMSGALLLNAEGRHFFDTWSDVSFLVCAVTAFAAWLHWLRFRVPITIAAGVAAALAGGIALLIAIIPGAQHWLITILFIAGLFVFALALWWDTTDTARRTWRSDVAFWLHLLAAPLLVHPLFSSLGVLQGQTTIGQAVAVIGLYVAIAFVALSIDRKALMLMVSALAYVLYAFSALLKQHGVVSLHFAIAALLIGVALLLLSAFWHTSRRHALRLVPSAIRTRLAPLR